MKNLILLVLLCSGMAFGKDYPLTARVIETESVSSGSVMQPVSNLKTGEVTGFIDTDDSYRRAEFEINGTTYICTGYVRLVAGSVIPARMDNRRIYFLNRKGKERHYRIRGTRVAP